MNRDAADAQQRAATDVAASSSGTDSVLTDQFDGEVLLITGFPGLRARSLVRVLAEREHASELWLVVPPAELEGAARALVAMNIPRQRLRLIPGEPCAIDLGLSRQTYAELAQRVARWFAFYQTADLRARRELCFRANLGSAREILELSRVARRLSHVTFWSSPIVFGDHQGDVDEEELSVGQSFRTPAAESLALAEAMLWRGLSQAPVCVLRTPPVLAETKAITVERANSLHRLLSLVAAAPADVALPLPPGASRSVHAVPADFVAEAAYAVSALGTRGHRYHFAEPEPPTLAEVLEQAAAHFGRRLEHAFDPRALGRLLLNNPGLWLSPQSSRALAEWSLGPRLLTRAGDRLLGRASMQVPPLLSYFDGVLRQTEELTKAARLDDRPASTPFEVVA